ncbi:MAG TPA: O-antigen ligase family protein [Verrucomicrobiae bacterium]|nr:O-antigen ligase family protein [Verrucomicrobiae bacterium]
MNREALDRWCERGILGLALCILAGGPLALGAVRNLDFAVIQGLTLGVMVLWMARLWLAEKPRLLWPPICWGVVACVVYVAVRYFHADVEYLARLELLHVLVYGFLFLAILNNLHRQETIQVVTYTVLFVGMAIAFYGTYQFFTSSDKVWNMIKPYPHRGSGTFYNPNHFAGFLEMLLPLGLAYTLTGRLKPVPRVFFGYVSLVLLGGIAVSVSKGGWIATGLSLLAFFGILLFQRRYRIPALALMVLLVAACAYVFPRNIFFQLRLKQMFSQNGNVNDELRYSVWRPALRMWREHPLWGVGPGHFNARFPAYRPEGLQMAPEYAHNDYLNTLADWGAVGTGLVAITWGLLAFGLVQTWSSVRLSSGDLGGKSGSNKFAFVCGAAVGLLSILLHSVVDFNLHIPANAIMAVTLMALLTSHLRFATESYWFRWRIGLKLLATVLILSGVWYMGTQAWRQGSEQVWLARAHRASLYSPEQVKLLKSAYAVEPMNPQTAYRIGEAYRKQSEEGGQHYSGQEGVDYLQLATNSMQWFRRSMDLNKWDSRSWAGYGWCLDWLDQQTNSLPYFWHAEELDPNNYYNLNTIGLHFVQTGDFAAARPWFERSLRLSYQDNPIAVNYQAICIARLEEAATNDLASRLNLRGQ